MPGAALGFDLKSAWLLNALSRYLDVPPAQVLTLALQELARSRDFAVDAQIVPQADACDA